MSYDPRATLNYHHIRTNRHIGKLNRGAADSKAHNEWLIAEEEAEFNNPSSFKEIEIPRTWSDFFDSAIVAALLGGTFGLVAYLIKIYLTSS